MRLIKKYIPLCIKCPISIFLKEVGKIPLQLVWTHMYCGYVNSKNSSKAIKEKAHDISKRKTYKYLESHYRELVLKLTQKPYFGDKIDNAPIWVMWWQGEQKAPEIVKHCISSIKRNSGNHPVKIVDSTNYQEYVDIPEHIAEKFSQGIISVTHFSDYYRMALLEKYGGLWIDASIYVKNKIEDSCFLGPLFTVKNPGKDEINISNWEWTVGVIGGWKGNTLFNAVRKLLEDYWKSYDATVNYFIFDYMIKMLYDNCDFLKTMIQAVPENNSHFYYLQNNADLPFSEDANEAEVKSDTFFYKISWKGKYLLKTAEGEDTVYSKWVKECIELETTKSEK